MAALRTLAGLLGYSHFESGDHITDLGGRHNADQVYLQLTLTF